MIRYTALLDANILYSNSLRDICLQLSRADVFQAKWTEDIHQEWMNARLKNDPRATQAKLARTRGKIDEETDGLITGYEHLIPELDLPDPDDRHVLAAAIVGRCDAIITKDLRGFPGARLAPHRIAARHPDEFLLERLNLASAPFCMAIKEIRSRLINPSYSVEEYLSNLRKQGLAGTASALEKHAHLL
ncbi:MAG: PIN domain-containing protein [Alphaproteobacteria bacterium]|nr:PIN domain-containing protein [Alphaproteobacteria bacterium]MDA8004263.1 PIN domain-containing protein [Alphaproteobacteria bacterium]MDA8006064.1 PIN domain-containing protein [Alphaproteobacteria bacterium]MDA8013195.1 PIN domain-containing protein [Alphaproteobacteria bacterium]